MCVDICIAYVYRYAYGYVYGDYAPFISIHHVNSVHVGCISHCPCKTTSMFNSWYSLPRAIWILHCISFAIFQDRQDDSIHSYPRPLKWQSKRSSSRSFMNMNTTVSKKKRINHEKLMHLHTTILRVIPSY